MISDWNDEQIQKEYYRLTKLGWNRAIDIAKRRQRRHDKVDFDNPLFIGQLKQLEDEMKSRGLK